MAQFLAIYTGPAGASQPDKATLVRGMEAWGEWAAR
jgi:hypothetical protein